MKKVGHKILTFFASLYSHKDVLHSDKYNRRIAFLNRYSVLFHALASLLIVFAIEAMSRRSVLGAASFVGGHTLAYLYNAFLIFVSLSMVYLFRRRCFFRFIICSFWMLLGLINGCVLSKRVTPFGFTDLSCIDELLDMTGTGYLSLWQLILIAVGMILFLFSCTVLFVRMPKYRGKRHKLMAPVMAILLFFVGIPATTTAAQASEIVDTYYSNIAQGYQDNGFVYSFSSSVVDVGMSKPEDYSYDTVDNILDETQVLAESEGKKASKATSSAENSSSRPNVICILLESFCDPDEINYLNVEGGDPIPTFHSLEQNYSTGYLTVPVVGAGTANTEFEVLTGMSLSFFGTGEYPYKTILKDTDCESIASDLSSIGYATHAVHNNSGSFYDRINAFSQMGFDTFTSKELMNITEYNPLGSWANDSILASETIKTLDSTPDQTDFTYTITVGTHGAYPTEEVIEDPEYPVTGCYKEDGTVDEASNNQWTYYVNQLHQCDEFINDLITELSDRDEDTIVVLWGDHLPTMGLTDEDMKSGDIYKTKYVTWNNMGLDKEDADLYAYQLMAHITDSVGIHKGTIMNYHQTRMASGEAASDRDSYMAGLDDLQFDILYGERYCYNGVDAYPATTVTMGVEEVVLENITAEYDHDTLVQIAAALKPEDEEEDTEISDEDTGAASETHSGEVPDEKAMEKAENMLLVTGENFTPWSSVYVNDKKVDTTYISGTELAVSAKEIKEGDTVIVCQLGSANALYRTSNSFVY